MKSELKSFEQYIQGCLNRAKGELAKYPRTQRSVRSDALVLRLVDAFSKRTCPKDMYLLLAGEAADDYGHSEIVNVINRRDRTPRNYWQAISPEMLWACEDALPALEPEAFCYVLPAFLRVMMERPYYLDEDKVLFYLCYKPESVGAELLAPLSSAERDVVTDALNEMRCWAVFVEEVDVDSFMLPWEHQRYLSEGSAMSPRQFCELLALEYAHKHHILDK